MRFNLWQTLEPAVQTFYIERQLTTVQPGHWRITVVTVCSIGV